VTNDKHVIVFLKDKLVIVEALKYYIGFVLNLS